MKINLKESLNKIDLATNNKYDLLNTFDSKKLSDENKKKLAEAIENNSIASINKILHESNEQLYKVVISSGVTKRDFESALYEDEAEEIVDYYGGRWIDEDGFEWNMYVEEDDDSTEHAIVDNIYDIEDDDERSQREMAAYAQLDEDVGPNEWEKTDFLDNDGKKVYINIIKEAEDIDDLKDIVHDLYWHDKGLFAMLRNFPKDKSFKWIQNRMIEVIKSTMNESLTEASYGGAYDIEDDMFFTKEDIVEFVDNICEYLGDVFGYQYGINNVYMDGSRKLYINIYDNNYIEVESTFDIDMRKIRKPSDLFKVYGLAIENWFQKAFAREYRDAGLDESLTEIDHINEMNKSLKEQINLPGYAVKYTTGYSGNGINSGKTEWFRTKEERDRRVKELKDKNYTEIKTWEMDNFYHTLPKEECLEESNVSYVKKAFAFDIYKDGDKYVVVNGDGDSVYESDNTLDCLKWAKKNSSKGYDFNNKFDFSRLKESLNEAYEYLYNQPFLKTFDEFVSKVSGLKADELDDEVWNEYFYEYQVYNEKYKAKDFENKLRKSLEEKDLEVISIEPNETSTLVIVKFDGTEKKFRFKFKLFDVDDYTEEYYIHYIISMIADYFGLNESLKEDFDDEYESDFDDNEVEEGNHVFADGEEYVWVERIAGPIYLDFDKWSVWSAREYVDPRDFMTIHDDGKGYDFDGDAFKEKAMAAPITYFVVEEDTGFIDWGPEDNEIAAKDFLNGKKEDWENDMDESLNEDKELNEYYIVNLHYEDIGDGREYDYEADYDDVLEYLMEICVDDDNAPEDTQEYIDWVEANFDYLLKKYEYRVLNYFEEDASQEEYDRRHSSYEPEYDPMD